MESIRISDRTLKEMEGAGQLSFRDRLETAKMLDRLRVQTIELPPIGSGRADLLLVKSIASAVKNVEVAVQVLPEKGSAERTMNALKEAKRARLQVSLPFSTVQMEYLYHKKQDAMLSLMRDTLQECLALTGNVELICEDAARAEPAFLAAAVKAAAEEGAKIITFCDTAGSLLPAEVTDTLGTLLDAVPSLKEVTLGFSSSDAISMAESCAVAAIACGAREIKAAVYPKDCVSLLRLVRLLSARGDTLGVGCPVPTTELNRISAQIGELCGSRSAAEVSAPAGSKETSFSRHDTQETVLAAAAGLGYTLSAEEGERLWNAFRGIAERKEEISLPELEALIASEAQQVPAVYRAESFVINTGNVISAMAHMKLRCREKPMEGISTGDGAIDAAFRAIEQAIGRHFELDDLQIQSITEGREAMGRTVVKLRSDGKLYSGMGISTDIVGASVMAYLSALNKIVFEEEEA